MGDKKEEIKRYDLAFIGTLVERENGYLVYYKDHNKALSEERKMIIKEIDKRLEIAQERYGRTLSSWEMTRCKEIFNELGLLKQKMTPQKEEIEKIFDNCLLSHIKGESQ